jgi:hypothetical protein
MTKGEAKVSETDAVIFPTEFGQNKPEEITTEEKMAKLGADKPPVKTGVEVRFSRLRKSVRKRSASIL